MNYYPPLLACRPGTKFECQRKNFLLEVIKFVWKIIKKKKKKKKKRLMKGMGKPEDNSFFDRVGIIDCVLID